MKLMDALDQVEQLDDDAVIFAKRPWALDCIAEIGVLDADLRVPKSVVASGFEYFIEASVAKEALEVFGDKRPSLADRRALLLFYAENDAFPDWVYKA